MNRVYGWNSDAENRRGLETTSFEGWRKAVRGQFQAPAKMDPRPWFLRTDQLQQGACAGFALAGSGQFNYYRATGTVKRFSEQFCYIEVQRRDGLLGQDRGSTIEGGEYAARNIGFPAYELWKYTGKYHTSPPGRSIEEVRKDAHTRLIQTTSTLRSYAEIFEWLSSGLGCVQIGILWNDSMEPRGGVIEGYDPRLRGGGHSALLAGYSDRRDPQGRNFLWLANWWYETWGNHGWAEVAPAAVDAWYRNPQTVIRGHSDLAGDGVQPRPIDWAAGNHHRPKGYPRGSK